MLVVHCCCHVTPAEFISTNINAVAVMSAAMSSNVSVVLTSRFPHGAVYNGVFYDSAGSNPNNEANGNDNNIPQIFSPATLSVGASSGNAESSGPLTDGNNNHTSVDTMLPQIPAYVRTTAMCLCIAIMILGVVGNIMVPIVIVKTKDMRNSTNIFLTNLSIADLLVLLVCTPTVLVEVNTRPETWILGHEMCKAVPFVELTVAHASVLTILAISFERYYAICEPLKAGYVCTKARAILICVLAWTIAALFTSPMILIATYQIETDNNGDETPICYTAADSLWPTLYFAISVLLFFFVPFVILFFLYAAIAYKLLRRKSAFYRPTSPQLATTVSSLSASVMDATTAATAVAVQTRAAPQTCIIRRHQQSNGMQQHRKQVIFMLLAVVASFFFCHLPFRALTLWIILAGTAENMAAIGMEGYYGILYFCRIMFYLNSALNPILYNVMSTKFRNGFWHLASCCCGPGRQQRQCVYARGRNSAMRQGCSVNRELGTKALRDSSNSSTQGRRRIFRRGGTFLVNSMSTSSGSAATERTSWRSGSSLSNTTSSAASGNAGIANCVLAAAEKQQPV